ncbi:methyltransferase [Vibrio aquaticus]|uniref:Methyltransferase n=1 Tax=Vibrio aquaticus TaxID=2496559 RepID=A0A432CYH4_9VIBR|nr:methyltransferase [Vibrio aquaticus]RTZ16426.1 methyltransferase [Vibrio aquaticus]
MLNTFQSIDQFLLEHQTFWRFEPFFSSARRVLPWKSAQPELTHWLNTLSPQEIEHFKQSNDELVDALSQYLPSLKQLLTWTNLQQVQIHGLELARGVDSGVPGRKLEQIVSMGEAALTKHAGSEWLEWCSGKGFLGRILASQSGEKVTSFEFQSALCQSGQHEADRQGLDMHFVQGDALSAESITALNPNQHAVALHACGDLHVSLIQKGVEQRLPALTLSPCCYHLIQGEEYQPLSIAAQQSTLQLSKSELRIPLQETVTGGERVKRHRLEEMTYRLGFDLLLNEALGFEQYQPVPSVKKSQLSDGFEAFCRWASDKKGIELPSIDFEYYERLGHERYWQMERMSLVQQPFRRLLELWLVYDKALYLQQSGYQVMVSEFCSRETTPRNLLIHASKL